MELPTHSLQNNKTIIGTIFGAVALIGLGFYLVTVFQSPDTANLTQVTSSSALLGQNSALFIQTVTQDKPSLDSTAFLDSYLIKNSQDFTQTIGFSTSHGRPDPFVPSLYASSRPSR